MALSPSPIPHPSTSLATASRGAAPLFYTIQNVLTRVRNFNNITLPFQFSRPKAYPSLPLLQYLKAVAFNSSLNVNIVHPTFFGNLTALLFSTQPQTSPPPPTPAPAASSAASTSSASSASAEGEDGGGSARARTLQGQLLPVVWRL